MGHSTEEFLGVDLGAAKVGIARGSTEAGIAQPLKTVAAGNIRGELQDLIKKYRVSGVVVGLPRNLEGDETYQTKTVKEWVEKMAEIIGIPFYWQDEAVTSRLAASKKDNSAGEDAIAASMILQDFLDTPKEERVRC